MFGDCLENLVRVEIELAHSFGEEIPLHLHVREEKMLGGEQGMTTALGLVGRAVHNPSGSIPNFAGREVEVVYLHGRLLRLTSI
jgi:hypothetical protein